MPNVRLDGALIAYRESGAGVPLVFCHEFAGSMESWDPQISYFARRHRAIAYNAKGYPPSEVPPEWQAYTYEHQVQVLAELLDHLDISSAHICGLSMGAYTAVQFGLAHPERCLSIIAAGVGTGSSDPDTFLQESELRAASLEAAGMQGMEPYLAGATRIRFRAKDPAGWSRFAELFMQHSPLGSANTLRGFQGRRPSIYTREADLAQSGLPMLVVVGDEDDPCLEPSLFLRRTVPRCGLVALPQTGHACNLEEPALFNSAVAEFIAQVEANRWDPRPEDSGDNWAATKR